MADGHGAITLGSGCSGGIRNIFAEDCDLDSTNLNTAIRVKNNAIRGGRLENFNVRNIRVGHVAQQVIEVDYYYEEGTNGTFIPVLRDFVVENVVVTGGAPHSIVVRGYPEPDTSIIRISLYNISFTGVPDNDHFVIENVNEITARDVYVNGKLWALGSGGIAISAPAMCGLLLFSVVILIFSARIQ